MAVKESTFHQRARRDQMVDLAVELIGEGGVRALSISAVARRAGVSRGVVGYNVGDLDDLLRLVVERAYAVGRDRVGPAVESAGDPVPAVRAFVTASLRLYREAPALMRALREIFADPDLMDRASTAEHRREVDELSALLRAGQEDGSIVAGDVDLLAHVVRAALDLAAGRIGAGEDADTLQDDLVALVERVLRP